jgi:LPXTG-site transpeptidase (sortase) family protein
LPIRLEIPKIKVDAALDYVGITSNGELGVPAGPANAAWYDQGPRPGDTGSAVIDGHFGYKDNIPAVFDNLHDLQIGDKIYVKDVKGLTTTFVVRQLRTYGSDEPAPDVFHSSDGKAHLNLITCQGDWNQTQKSYSTRLVVFTDKVT